MTAPAARRAWLPPAASLAALIAFASPAAAQVGAAVSLFSDDRFRGVSLSDGHPAGIIDLSYDAADGLYGSVSGSAVWTRHDGLQPLGLQLNAGYATRLSSSLTLDLGAIHSNYSHYSSRAGRSYTEVYAGLSGKLLSGRIYLSPDYLKARRASAYGEIEANFPLAPKWRLTAHAGMLVPLRRISDYETYQPRLDWRLGISREIGHFSIQTAWTGAQRRRDSEPYRNRGGNTLVVGLSWVR